MNTKQPKFPGTPEMFGVYVAGSGVHGYFDIRSDAEAYQKKLWDQGCYYVPIFQNGDGSNYENS